MLLNQADQEVTEEVSKRNIGLSMSVDISFNNIVQVLHTHIMLLIIKFFKVVGLTALICCLSN